MNRDAWAGLAVLGCAALFMGSTLFSDLRQNERLDRQQATIERQQRQLDRDLLQIGQLNRRVFDLPEITQGLTGGQP